MGAGMGGRQLKSVYLWHRDPRKSSGAMADTKPWVNVYIQPSTFPGYGH